MTMLFTADLHFNHRGIIDYCKRPFADVAEMNAALIAAWNGVVKPSDEVHVLGDFAFPGESIDAIFGKLNGTKHLTTGNHDEKNPKVLKLPWASVSPLRTIRWEGARFVACHYPLETWKNAQHGYLHVHGHSHGSLKRVIPHRFDVGVDADYSACFAPIHAASLLVHAAEQSFDPQDHHGD